MRQGKIEQDQGARVSHIDGLEESVVPVDPLTSRTEIEVSSTASSKLRRTVVRRQFPITPASGLLTLFNVYVALSRSAGRSTIRLLRDFDEQIFLKAFSMDLTQEDERLQWLDERMVKDVNRAKITFITL
jgi:hypothetical protein